MSGGGVRMNFVDITVILFLFVNMGISSTIYIKLGELTRGQHDTTKNIDRLNVRLDALEARYNRLEVKIIGWAKK